MYNSQLSCELGMYLPELNDEEQLRYQSPEMLINSFNINTSSHRMESDLFDPIIDDKDFSLILADIELALVNNNSSDINDITNFYWEQSTVAPRSVARNFPRGVPASGKTCRSCGSFLRPVLPSRHFFLQGGCPCPWGTPHPLATPLVVPHVPNILHESQINVNFQSSSHEMYNNQQNSMSTPSSLLKNTHHTNIKKFCILDTITGRKRRPFLYEFIRLVLDNDEYSHLAEYIDRKRGIFKLNQPNEIAELWRLVKGRNSDNVMTYDKFARAIRYYYRSEIMHATPGRFTFRFGPQSGSGSTWRPAF